MDISDIIPDNKYLLVSDSNEKGNQYDSKKLSQEDLIDLAQDNLFKKTLNIMSRYLTISQFITFKDMLDGKIPDVVQSYSVDDWSGLYRAVDGQVIFLHAGETDNAIDAIYQQQCGAASEEERASIRKISPYEYFRSYWYIPSEFVVEQLQDCMLRGVTEIRSEVSQRTQNQSVGLASENIPPHMHHSGITSGQGIQSMGNDGNVNTKVGFQKDEIRYDLFYNDSFSTGVNNNELEGVVDDFSVVQAGTQEQNMLYHNNMPSYTRFYAFLVRRNSN